MCHMPHPCHTSHSNLPKQLSSLLEPSFNGYPSPPAHNVVNMLLVANPASAAAVYYAALMPMLVKRNVPVRFGAIFYTDNVLQVLANPARWSLTRPFESACSTPQTAKLKPQTTNPKPQTPNPKPQATNRNAHGTY